MKLKRPRTGSARAKIEKANVFLCVSVSLWLFCVFSNQLIHRTKPEGPGWADPHAGGFQTVIYPFKAGITLAHFGPLQKSRGPKGAGREATAADDTKIRVYLNDPVPAPPFNGPCGANDYTGCVHAIEAGNGGKRDLSRGIGPCFDPCNIPETRAVFRQIILIHACHNARHTAAATGNIKRKA